jgi:hypothetical protein
MQQVVRHHSLAVLALLLLVCTHSCAAQQQQLQASSSIACPSSLIQLKHGSSTPITFKPGYSYSLGPGSYTMPTATLKSGETLCISGSGASGSQATTLLPMPPTTAAAPSGSSASRLHFLLQGGSLQLTNLTLSGTPGEKAAPGGGVVIQSSSSSSSSNGSDEAQSSQLVTDHVMFRQVV